MINTSRLPLPLLLALLTAIAPLAIDMYLPAMANMASSLNSDIHHVELSVSTFLLGFALGQITGGPLSDSVGRKPVIYLGLTIFGLASLALIWVTTLDELLILRVVQAIGGGLAVVNSTAIVRDNFDGADIARVLSMIAMIMMAAPMIAPMLGSIVLHFSQWHTIFGVLAAYSAVLILLLVWQLPESHPKHKRVKRKPWEGYAQVIRHRSARRYIFMLASSFSGMFVFITASPYLYLEHFEQSASMFPWLFGANVAVVMLMNRLNMTLLKFYSPTRLMTTGVAIQFSSAIALVVLSFFPDYFTLGIALPLLMAFVGSLGLITANTMGTIMQHFREVAASATALMGVIQFSGGALAGLLWGKLHDGTPMPMMAVCLLTASLSAVFLISALRADANTAPITAPPQQTDS
jgi:DHA1 family bicyclomycin/chloramphenicol resistance-like MFS transporter